MPEVLHNCDLVILWDYKGISGTVARSLIVSGKPYCYYSGGILHFRSPMHWLKKFVFLNLCTRVIRHSSAIVLSTSRESRRLRYLIPFFSGRNVCIPHEVSYAFADTIKDSADCFRIGYMGRIDIRTKGLDILIKAFSSAYRIDKNIKLELAGPDHMGVRNVLKQIASELGVENAVDFTGPFYGDDKAAFFRRIDLFVHPCKYEAFGITIVEAMLSGTPVVLSDKANLADDLSNAQVCEITGLSVEEIANRILKLKSDKELRDRLARKGREWAEANCSTDAVGENTLRLLKEILGTSGVCQIL